jgi:hypothetical protein
VTAERRRSSAHGFTLVQLLVSLGVILLLVLVVPLSFATAVIRARIARAENDVRRIAQRVEACGPAAAWSTWSGMGRAGVLGGAGQLPIVGAKSRWAGRLEDLARVLNANGRAESLEAGAQEIAPDPWGHRYLVNVGAIDRSAAADSSAGALWVLSAGPDGIIQTPFDQAGPDATLRGDDIGVRLR